MRLIGVDVGGTFTDLVYADTEAGETAVHKVSTTPDDPSRGVVAGLMALCDKYGIPRETIDVVFHGTTIATNAILEHDGARHRHDHDRAAIRDILHIGRHQRPQHYSIMQDIPWQDRPLVKRRHRKTVTERLVPPQRRGAGAARRGRRARRRRASCKRRGRRGDRHLLPVLLPRPRARGARARRSCARSIPSAFVTTSLVGVAAVPRVRALHDDGDERLRRPEGAQLRDAAGERRSRDAGFKADLHIMASNGGVATPQHGGRAARAHAALRPGRRRARRRLGGRARRAGATSSPSTSAARRPTSASSPTAASARPRRATPGSPASPCWCR